MSEHEAPRRRGSESFYGGDTYGEAIDQAVRSSPATRGNSVFPSWTPASPHGTWELAESGAASNANGARGHSALPMMLGAMSPLAALTMKAFGVGHQTTDVSATSSAPNEHAGTGGKESFDRNETVPRHAEDHDEDALHTLSQRNRQRLDDFGYSMAVWETLSEVTRKQVAEMVGWLAFVGLLSVVVMKGKGLAALRALLKTDMAKALGYAIPAGAASVHFSKWFNEAWDANGNPAKRGKARDEFAGLCMSLAAWRMQFGFGKGANAKAPGKVTAEVDNAVPRTRARLTTTAAANTTTLQLNPLTKEWEVPHEGHLALPGPTVEPPAVQPGTWLSPLGPQPPAAGMEGFPAFGGGGFLAHELSEQELTARLSSKYPLAALKRDLYEGEPNIHEKQIVGVIEKASELDKPYLERLLMHWMGVPDRSPAANGGPRFEGSGAVVTFRTADPTKPAAGGMASVVSAMKGNFFWYGWNGKRTTDPSGAVDSEAKINHVPLVTTAMPEVVYRGHYLWKANSEIWPVFHSDPNRAKYLPGAELAYAAGNQLLGARAAKLADPESDIVVHDYQLYELIRELILRGHRGKVGHFLHIPWPPLEILMTCPYWKELVISALLHHLLGFHTPEYMKKFIQAAEVIGARVTMNSPTSATVLYDGEVTELVVRPIGIDTDLFSNVGTEVPEELETIPGFKKDKSGTVIATSAGRIDWTKNGKATIEAIDLAMTQHPEMQGRFVYLFVGVPSREELEEYKIEAEVVRAAVAQINAKYGREVVRHIDKAISQPKIASIYNRSHIQVATSLKDGWHLGPGEFHLSQDPRNPGISVMGDIGAKYMMGDHSIVTNPTEVKSMADGFFKAWKMSGKEGLGKRREHYEANDQFLRTNTAERWANGLNDSLRMCPKKNRDCAK